MSDFFGRAQQAQQSIRAPQTVPRASWREVLFRPRVTRQRDAWVQVDHATQRELLGVIAEAAPAVATAINRRLVPVAERALSEWPVRTGRSRASIGLDLSRVGPGVLRASVQVRAFYAGWVRRGESARSLILRPGEQAGAAMAADIGAALGD